jgi:hypothetical protein
LTPENFENHKMGKIFMLAYFIDLFMNGDHLAHLKGK